MPLVNVKVIENVFSEEQKNQMVESSPKRWSRSKVRTCAG